MKEYVATSGLVNMRPAGDGIYVLKYKKKVFYENLLNVPGKIKTVPVILDWPYREPVFVKKSAGECCRECVF